MRRFAARLAARLPWLTRGRHYGHLISVLIRHRIDPADWSVTGLLDALDARNRDSGWSSLAPDAQRDPLAVLAHALTTLPDSWATGDLARHRHEQILRDREHERTAHERTERHRTAAPPHIAHRVITDLRNRLKQRNHPITLGICHTTSERTPDNAAPRD